MKKIIGLLALAILLAAPVFALESEQLAMQNLWWTYTLTDTVAAGDYNLWWVGADTSGATNDFVEVAVFISDQPGSLIWWNGSVAMSASDSTTYAADTVYWHFNASEDLTITAKGGIDSMEVHNTGASAANNRLIGMRR